MRYNTPFALSVRFNRFFRGFTLLIVLLGIVRSLAHSSEIYQFVDASGTIHFTDTPTHTRYRPILSEGRKVPIKKSSRSVHTKARYPLMIDQIARAQDMDPALIKAVIRAESDFDPNAVSSSGAQGLMQLMPKTAKEVRVDNPFDPEENVRGGTQYLRSLLRRFNNDLPRALAAYHAGAQTVEKHGGIPPIEATQTYIKRVLSYYKGYSPPKSGIYYATLPSGQTLYTDQPERYTGISFQPF